MSEKLKIIATNRKARHNYHISNTIEAGIQLVGSEVKSLRDGRVNFRDSYAGFKDRELYLLGLDIPKYSFANQNNHEPDRDRKLLLHRHQIDRLAIKLKQQGFTLVPLRLYFRGGRVKVELGLAKGKKLYDKRHSIRRRDLERAG